MDETYKQSMPTSVKEPEKIFFQTLQQQNYNQGALSQASPCYYCLIFSYSVYLSCIGTGPCCCTSPEHSEKQCRP